MVPAVLDPKFLMPLPTTTYKDSLSHNRQYPIVVRRSKLILELPVMICKTIYSPFLHMAVCCNSNNKTLAQSSAILQDIPILVSPVSEPS